MGAVAPPYGLRSLVVKRVPDRLRPQRERTYAPQATIALPLNMFYNTSIATYVWVLTLVSQGTAAA